MASETPHLPKPGRPRSEHLDQTILTATSKLIGVHGYAAVTTEMIANEAGVGKQSLYRRWPSKAELVLAALTAFAQREIDAAVTAAPLARGLPVFLRRTFEALAQSGPALRQLMAIAQDDAAFRVLFKAQLVEPRRDALRRFLRKGCPDASPRAIDAAVVALFGALWYRLLLDEPLDAAFAKQLATLVLDGLG
jgi:AcrR family transcriptional regulator